VFNAIRGIDYSGHQPQNLRVLPPEPLLPQWKDDYRSMQEQFIYGPSPSWDELVKALRSIEDRLHGMVI